MNRYFTRPLLATRAQRVLIILAVAAGGLVAGCSNKPPGCADSDVKKAVIDTALKVALTGDGDVPQYHAYYKKAKLELVGVTTGGYDEGARKHACGASLTITDPHDTVSIPLTYTVQGVEGSQGEYRVAYYDSGYPLRLTLMGIAQKYMANYAEEERASAAAAASVPDAPVNARVVEPESRPANAQSAPAAAESPVAAAMPALGPSVDASVPVAPVNKSVATVPDGPSFSCAGKLSRVEKLICDAPALSHADATMALAYAKALSAVADLSGVKQKQRDWRKTRDACADVECVQASYATRTEELSR